MWLKPKKRMCVNFVKKNIQHVKQGGNTQNIDVRKINIHINSDKF